MAAVGKRREYRVSVMVFCYCLARMLCNRTLALLLLVLDAYENSTRMREILLKRCSTCS